MDSDGGRWTNLSSSSVYTNLSLNLSERDLTIRSTWSRPTVCYFDVNVALYIVALINVWKQTQISVDLCKCEIEVVLLNAFTGAFTAAAGVISIGKTKVTDQPASVVTELSAGLDDCGQQKM